MVTAAMRATRKRTMSTRGESGDIGQDRSHPSAVVPRALRIDHGHRLAARKRIDAENMTTGTEGAHWKIGMVVAGTTREESLDTGVLTATNAKRDVLHATTLHLVDDARHLEYI